MDEVQLAEFTDRLWTESWAREAAHINEKSMLTQFFDVAVVTQTEADLIVQELERRLPVKPRSFDAYLTRGDNPVFQWGAVDQPEHANGEGLGSTRYHPTPSSHDRPPKSSPFVYKTERLIVGYVPSPED